MLIRSHPFPQSSVVGHYSSTRLDQIGICCNARTLQFGLLATVLGDTSTNGSVAPVQLWLVLVASFLLVTREVPARLMAEPVWLLSAAGEPFLRAEIVSQPSFHCPGKIPFSLVMQCHSGCVFLDGIQGLESW